MLCLGGPGCPNRRTMLRFISRALAFFRRRVNSSEAEREQQMRLLEGIHFDFSLPGACT